MHVLNRLDRTAIQMASPRLARRRALLCGCELGRARNEYGNLHLSLRLAGGVISGADPSAALCTYKASSKLEKGLASSLTYPNTPHHGPYATDEPQSMPGGQNTGPNPMDLVLGALTTCQDISYKAYATARFVQEIILFCAIEDIPRSWTTCTICLNSSSGICLMTVIAVKSAFLSDAIAGSWPMKC